MANVKVNINGFEFVGYEGQSILDIALARGIDIPTLCHDDRVKAYGSCGVCVVEVEGLPRPVRACSTLTTNGMVINTETAKVRETRKVALELLLSDHSGDCRPPCVVACPGQTDCQGYVGLIANGEYKEALELIKDKIPMPASIGRVCPHPCEEACRRELVEEPISIAHLKSFVADIDLGSGDVFTPEVSSDTGKRIAVIGGGPGGLTAAYFLRRLGHQVTIFDKMPKMGGMLRYGIPEYRLPKTIVDDEVMLIEDIGINMVNGIEIGKDMSFSHVRANYDATLVAIGAWSSSSLRCPGEELDGVVGGIDFLRDAALNNPMFAGKKVAIVGGGNTAMDACRTAVRLGADQVYNIYRRTKDEMPAEDIEIIEAEEEGVVFKYLTNPIEVIGNNEKVSQIRLQKMELGEPDASGRRAPVAIQGEEELLDVDTVIVAIGQGVDPKGLEELELTKWKTIVADENTYKTNLQDVFAIGDATNNGASIAIAAIGDAKRAANVIDSYLNGEVIPYTDPYLVKRDLDSEDFKDTPKAPRVKMPHRKPEQRRGDFGSVNEGYTEEMAKSEAKRCLECGCGDYFECKLIDYANQYSVKPEKYEGDVHTREWDLSNPFLLRNPDKCILCGLCIRVCDEVMGRTALGFVERGFDTVVKPALGLPLAQTDCISCGQCVSLCPTGALIEALPIEKPLPMVEEITHSTCSYCSVGCKTKIVTKGSMQVRSLPHGGNGALLCAKGRFGFGQLQKQDRILTPMINKKGLQSKSLSLEEVELDEALMYITKKTQGLTAKYGANSMGVTISDRLTNEEIYLIKKYANEVLNTDNVYTLNGKKSGLSEVLGKDASTNTFDELENTEVIILISDDIVNNHTIAGIKIKKAVENGAKLILITSGETQAQEWADIVVYPDNNSLEPLKQLASAIIDLGFKPDNATGFEDLKASLDKVVVSEQMKAIAQMYTKAKKAMIVFDQNNTTVDVGRMVANIGVIAAKIGKARSGIIQLKANNNSQGSCDMGVKQDSEGLINMVNTGDIKGLMVFGEDAQNIDTSKLEFIMVQDYVLTDIAKKADVILPAATAAQTNGTYTSTERQIQQVNAAIEPIANMENGQLIQKLANVSKNIMSYKGAYDVLDDIALNIPEYHGVNEYDLENDTVFWSVGESPVLYQDGFAFEDKKARLVPPQGNLMFEEKHNTNIAYSKFVKFMDSKGLIKR